MSWMRGKKCSSKRRGGIAWELYRHKTAASSEGLSPQQRPPKRPPSGSRCQVIPYAASTPCRITSGRAI
jgi:hypothetical protein